MTSRVANRGVLWGPQHPQSHMDSRTRIGARVIILRRLAQLTISGESFPAAMLKMLKSFGLHIERMGEET